MIALYGLGITIFGALFFQQAWIVLIGLVLVFGGGAWALISLVLEETGTNISLPKLNLPAKRDKQPPPLRLVKDVDNLKAENMHEGKLKGEVMRLNPLITDYPSLQRKVQRYKRIAYIKYRVIEHEHTLERNLERALVKDDYGTTMKDGREEEILRFLESMNANTEGLDLNETIDLVRNTLKERKTAQLAKGFDPNSAPEDGVDFEYWVAKQLRAYGWTTEVTKGSGDQGADVVARRDRFTVGIQCKRYSSNVGNKAIQEAISATQHYQFTKGAVITTSGYTKSAKELATSTGVILLTHYDIPKLAKLSGAI